MAAPIPSIVNSAFPTNDILSSATDPATASPAANNSPAATSPTESLTPSDLPVSISNPISTNASPTLSTTGTISSPVPTTTLLPSTPTAATPISLILTTSSTTPIPTTPQTSTFSNITPTPPPTSTPLSGSTSFSSSVSLTGTASIGSTTIVTVVSGTTVTSVLPTTLVNSPSADVVSRRTAAFAGAATGFVVLFLIILGLVFWYRRHKLRKALESTGKKKEDRGLLDGEEFDDDEKNLSTNNMQSYPYSTPVFDSHASSGSVNLMKSRTSETGSIFREEVWPPPGFIDPIVKRNGDVGLSGIVDDVMGPSSDQLAEPSAGPQEPHQPDESSSFAISSTSTSSLINTPARPVSSPSSSFIYPNAALTSSMISLPPPSARSSVNFQPRKSSPLTRASMSDPKLWLTRNVRQPTLP